MQSRSLNSTVLYIRIHGTKPIILRAFHCYHCNGHSNLLRLLRKRQRKRRPNSYCTRLLWRMTRRLRQRARCTATAWLSARACSLRKHACALHQHPEIQLHAPATFSPPHSAPFSTPSSPLFRPPDSASATLNTKKAWRLQAKDE